MSFSLNSNKNTQTDKNIDRRQLIEKIQEM